MFFLYLIMWIFWFAICFFFLGQVPDLGDDFNILSKNWPAEERVGDDFEMIEHSTIKLLITMFRTIIGDITTPKFRDDI